MLEPKRPPPSHVGQHTWPPSPGGRAAPLRRSAWRGGTARVVDARERSGPPATYAPPVDQGYLAHWRGTSIGCLPASSAHAADSVHCPRTDLSRAYVAREHAARSLAPCRPGALVSLEDLERRPQGGVRTRRPVATPRRSARRAPIRRSQDRRRLEVPPYIRRNHQREHPRCVG